MKAVNLITLVPIIVGGINWLLVGLFPVRSRRGDVGGQNSGPARLVYILVGLSALWQLVPLARAFPAGETTAERGL